VCVRSQVCGSPTVNNHGDEHINVAFPQVWPYKLGWRILSLDVENELQKVRMSPWLLTAFRFFVPAALILVYCSLFGNIVGLWTTPIPDFSKDYYLPIVIVPGALYYITPLRKRTNAPHHKKVTENLRRGLVSITGYPDKADKYTWKSLRPLFFSLVDGDESLKNKASLAYMNGLVWTSCADSTVLSILYAIFAALLLALGIKEAALALGVFCAIAIISIAGSVATTNKQIEIGNEQLEVIELKYKSDIEKRLNTLDN
jgi:hypothetical protein